MGRNMITGYLLLDCFFSEGILLKEKFDANEKTYTDWLPAIKLFLD